MAPNAWDWPWSSARAHTSPQGRDQLLDWPWMAWMEEARLGAWNHADWKASLAAGSPEALDVEQLRRATKLGEPLGSEAFVTQLEAMAGRRLRVQAPGRPARTKMAVNNGV